MIIGLTGYAGSGKDTAASKLNGYTRFAFADKLKELAYDLNPVIGQLPTTRLAEAVDEYGWEASKRIPAVRSYLQHLGNSSRGVFGEVFWISMLDMQLGDAGLWFGSDVVITDVRYQNEVDYIHDWGGRVFRITRPGVGPANEHVSEQIDTLENIDRTLLNASTPEEIGMLIRFWIQHYEEG